MPILRVLLNCSVSGRHGFLAIHALRPLWCLFVAMRKGTNLEALRTSPAHGGAEISRLLPHLAQPPSLTTDLVKKSQDPIGIMTPTKSHPSSNRAQSKCSYCFNSSQGGRPKMTLSKAMAQEHRHCEFCAIWEHLNT